MTPNVQTVEALKSAHMFFAAGALAQALGMDRLYGVHYGMKSTRRAAALAFLAGYDAADTPLKGSTK